MTGYINPFISALHLCIQNPGGHNYVSQGHKVARVPTCHAYTRTVILAMVTIVQGSLVGMRRASITRFCDCAF